MFIWFIIYYMYHAISNYFIFCCFPYLKHVILYHISWEDILKVVLYCIK